MTTWYKNAVIYCLSVGTYTSGNGIGDFTGLTRRLDYLHSRHRMAFQALPHRDTSPIIAASIRDTALSAILRESFSPCPRFRLIEDALLRPLYWGTCLLAARTECRCRADTPISPLAAERIRPGRSLEPRRRLQLRAVRALPWAASRRAAGTRAQSEHRFSTDWERFGRAPTDTPLGVADERLRPRDLRPRQ